MSQTLDLFDDSTPDALPALGRPPAGSSLVYFAGPPQAHAEGVRTEGAIVADTSPAADKAPKTTRVPAKRFNMVEALANFSPPAHFDTNGLDMAWAEGALVAMFSDENRKKYLAALPFSEVHLLVAAAWVYSGARDDALAAGYGAEVAVELLRGHRNGADALNAAYRVLDRHSVQGGLIPLVALPSPTTGAQPSLAEDTDDTEQAVERPTC